MHTKENIKQVRGNIPIDKKLLNKYSNVKNIFDDINILHLKSIKIDKFNILELKELKLGSMNAEMLKKVANQIFNIYHPNNIFINNEYKIVVTKSGISECIQKIYNSYKNARKAH